MKKNYFKSLMQASLLLGAALVVSSCDDIVGQEDNPVASYVQWDAKTPKSIELTLGIPGKDVFQIKAIAVSSATIVYESGNTEIAKVNPVTGEITAVGIGETFIKAVITGASSAGQSVFIPEEIQVPVVVKDGKAKLTRVKDEVIEYTANKDSVINLEKLFTAYPEVGTEDENSNITFTLLGKNSKLAAPGNNTNIAFINTSDELQIKNSYSNIAINGKGDISDTLYIAAQITGATTGVTGTPAFNYTDVKATVDTVMVVINKSIAFINKEGKREILTADKYKELDMTAATYDNSIAAGTYYITKTPAATLPTTDIKGDVNLIFKSTVDADFSNIDDKTDNATLNIFGEAISAGAPGKYAAWNPTINANNYPNAITNFAEINIYTGNINVTGAIINVKDVNMFGGGLTANDAIRLTGTLTVNGGAVNAYSWSTDIETGFAVIGDVVVNDGAFYAQNPNYRAIKGNLTAGKKMKFQTSVDGTTWADLTSASTNEKYVQAIVK